jgi:AraC-like DNA-binding protein
VYFMPDQVEYQQVDGVPGLVLGSARFSDFGFDRHFHLDYHIGLVTEGVQRQWFGGKTVLLGPGCISVMPPGEMHDGIAENGAAYTLKTFRLSQELVSELAAEIGDTHREPELAGAFLDDPALAGHLLRLHDAMQRSSDADGFDVQTEWLNLLEFLLRESRAIVPATFKGGLSPQQWSRVREFSLSHLDEKLTLETLAAICGLGKFQFLRQFKQSVGMTPHAWLMRLRLERACALLASHSLAIVDIAQAVGFYDQSHFNRAFRQAFGVAPSGY